MLARYALIAVCLAALAGVGLIAGPIASAQGPKAAWTPKKYVPSSKRDFTGLWENPNGIAWDPGAQQDVRLTAPLTPEYAARFKAIAEAAKAGKPVRERTADCLPQGMPRIMTMTYPMEIIQNAQQINIYAEWLEQTRRVFIDGRPLPPLDEVDITYNGASIGRWEGNVLVIETIGMRDDGNLEASGIGYSAALKVIERMWLETDDKLIDEITLVDPKTYSKPWTVKKWYKRMPPDARLLEYVCLENNRNPVGADGTIGAILIPNRAEKQ